MKKIAFALEKFSRYAGGAESYAVSLATTLIENGWEVHFLANRGTASRKKLISMRYIYRGFFRPGSKCYYLPGSTKK